MPGARFAIASGNGQQNVTYCSKEDSRAYPGVEPWTMGECRLGVAKGERKDLHAAKAFIEEGTHSYEVCVSLRSTLR